MRGSDNTKQAASKGSRLWRLLFVLGAVLLVVALVAIGVIGWQYLDAQNRYRDIQSIAISGADSVDNVSADTRLEDLTFDWAALKLINPDIIGWIIIPDTGINYPVVQSIDNVYYLDHLFDRTSSASGAIFADAEGSATLDASNNIIYGHNMLDGSMFAGIRSFTSQEYLDAHKTVLLCTPTRNFELTAIAATTISENAPLRQFSFSSNEAFTGFVRETLASPSAAVSDLSAVIAETESLYSLVTCESFDASVRTMLCCVPVRSVELDAQ